MSQYSSFTALFLLCFVSMATGCATITRGTTEAYAVQTNPPGAEVKSSSGWQCTTPCSIKVKRRGDFVLTISRPGFETVTASVTSSIDGAGAAGMAGNVLIGGIIGAGVDAGTGAMHSHKPNPLMVDMVPLGFGPQTSSATRSSVKTGRTIHTEYLPRSAIRNSYSNSKTTTSQGSQPTKKVYLDDYDRVLQQVPARKRSTVVLGQKNDSD